MGTGMGTGTGRFYSAWTVNLLNGMLLGGERPRLAIRDILVHNRERRCDRSLSPPRRCGGPPKAHGLSGAVRGGRARARGAA